MFKKGNFFVLFLLILVISAISSVSANDLDLAVGDVTSYNPSINLNNDSNELLNGDFGSSINNDFENDYDSSDNPSLQVSKDDNINEDLFDESITIFTNKSILKASSESANVIYFNSSVMNDGDGSKENPYKYLYSNRIASNLTAYFAEGSYDLDGSCILNGTKLIGESTNVIINSKVSNQYDLIIEENSSLELKNLYLNNFSILNKGKLIGYQIVFDGNDLINLDYNYSSEGLNSSYGGVIVCDGSSDSRAILNLTLSNFNNVHDAFNGGAIAAINSDISLIFSSFMYYSSIYKGGAIYCLDSNLEIFKGNFMPHFLSQDTGDDFSQNKFYDYCSYYGGSIFCENSNVSLNQSVFLASKSFSFGGCVAGFNSNIDVYLTDFNNSKSLTDGGGAIYLSKGELYINQSTFNNDSGEFGGAICNLNSIFTSYYSKYYNNYANSYGGVIYDIYGTLNLYTNFFGNSLASVGGVLYTRIPKAINLDSNHFGDSFAEEGASIFFDGKHEIINDDIFSTNVNNNSIDYGGFMIPLNYSSLNEHNFFANDYSVYAEFTATLNGEKYSIKSNPLYYNVLSENPSSGTLYFPWSTYSVFDDYVNMTIFDLDDLNRLTSILTANVLRNISGNIAFSDEFIDPSLNFYVYAGIDTGLYGFGLPGNIPTDNGLYENHYLIGKYSVDLSNKSNKQNITVNCSIDFGNPFLTIKYDNLYDAGSYNPVSLVLDSSYGYDSSFDSASGSSFSGVGSGSSSDSASSMSSNQSSKVLSSYYNSNNYGFVSSIKNQGEGGNCWAFAGLATLEACLKKATGVDYDFSEENAKNLMAAYSVFGLKIDTNFGGYDSMLLSYLASWLGPIDESAESYDDYSSISVQENPLFHIQNIKFLPPRINSSDNDLYKMSIRDNGAVSVMLNWEDDFHAVSLVGWDDDFVGYDSLGNYAKGAWIFKNSFGADWGYGGFGYLSYNQKLSEEIYPYMHAYTFIFSDTNPYTKVYQYDFAGVSEFYTIEGPVYYKNSFTAEDSSILSAFSTYFDRQTKFTVSVYKNGEHVLSQDGVSQAGYYTIQFKNQIYLEKGDEFSIVLKNHNDGYNCIPCSIADELTKKTFASNVSFISYDGDTWNDLYDFSNSCHVACIKAFTTSAKLNKIKINVNQFDSVQTKNINVNVNIDDFNNIKDINYCLINFIVNGKNYYGQIRDGKACLNLNLNEGINYVSIQYKDNLYESNIVKFNFTVNSNSNNQSFNALQDIINQADENSTVYLNRDYFFDEYFDNADTGVLINKTLVIDGNGHVINGLSKSTGFSISARNIVLKNITFKNTFGNNGAALYVSSINLSLDNCKFVNSSSNHYGGAIYSLFDLNINNCMFFNNSASLGGGLYLISETISHIHNSSFENNNASEDGSAAYIIGEGSVLFSSSLFANNHAESKGGAILSSIDNGSFNDCSFVNNSAKYGGAVFSNSKLNKFDNSIFSDNLAMVCGGALMVHNLVNVSESDFINNSVTDYNDMAFVSSFGGGAIYSFDNLNVYNSNFLSNYANGSGGAIFASEILNIYNSNFSNNGAKEGGAVFGSDWQLLGFTSEAKKFSQSFYCGSVFANNSASDYGGAIFSRGNLDINDSRFSDNLAKFGGAIFALDDMIVFSSNFTNNFVNVSGAAIYSNAKSLVKDSKFIDNSALAAGGAIYSYKDCSIASSDFAGNSANYGGAIFSQGKDFNSLSSLDIVSSNFTSNYVNKSGGAIYSEGKCTISCSGFDNNSAIWGTAIYAIAYLNVTGSNLSSLQEGNLIQFRYYHDDADVSYGEIYLKDNFMYSKYASSIFYTDDEPYPFPLFLVFDNITVIQGQNVSFCHMEDSEGNTFSSWDMEKLSFTLTDYEGNIIQAESECNGSIGSFSFDTSLLNLGIYQVTGSLPENYTNNYIVNYGILTLVKKSTLSTSGLTKVYLKNNKLVVTLKDGDGKAISNVYLIVKLNGKTTKLKTNSKGQISMAVNLAPKTYTAKISYEGNNKYSSASISTKVVIKKANVKIGASKKTFKLKAKTKSYSITLKNYLGSAMKKTKVTIKINGKTYTAKTNSKGKASFKLKLSKKGNYKAIIKFAGSKYYNKRSRNVVITVKK